MVPNEDKMVQATHDAQQSANIQAALSTADLGRHFGPKILALTDAINAASKSSGYLSKVLIAIAFIGTAIAFSQWYSAYGSILDFSEYSDETLDCIITHGKGQSQTMLGAVIEHCERELKN